MSVGPGTTGSAAATSQEFGFFIAATAFTISTHLISLLAYYANRSSMRWAEKS